MLGPVDLTLATFNVKDLFEGGGRAPVLPAKLEEIALQLQRADADVIGLEEVGSESLVRQVLDRMPCGEDYRVVFGIPDRRGIANALASRLPVLEQERITKESLPFPRFVQGDPEPFPGRLPLRRAVVRVKVTLGSHHLHVLCTHWKSKLPKRLELASGGDVPWDGALGRGEAELRSLVSRGAEALFLRGVIDRLAASGDEVALVGDLNDTADSLPVRIVRGEGMPHALHPCAELVPHERRISTLHRGSPEQIDHILVTERLHERLTGAGFFNEALRDHGPFDPGAPPTIDSDHALLWARFNL